MEGDGIVGSGNESGKNKENRPKAPTRTKGGRLHFRMFKRWRKTKRKKKKLSLGGRGKAPAGPLRRKDCRAPWASRRDQQGRDITKTEAYALSCLKRG